MAPPLSCCIRGCRHGAWICHGAHGRLCVRSGVFPVAGGPAKARSQHADAPLCLPKTSSSLMAKDLRVSRFADDVGNVRASGGKLEFYNSDGTTRRTVLRHVRMSEGIVQVEARPELPRSMFDRRLGLLARPGELSGVGHGRHATSATCGRATRGPGRWRCWLRSPTWRKA